MATTPPGNKFLWRDDPVAPVVTLVGPVVYSLQTLVDVPGPYNAYQWSIATTDTDGERIIAEDLTRDSHCSNPVWGTDIERILYQEVPINTAPPVDAPTSKVCIVNKDGSNRVVLFDSGRNREYGFFTNRYEFGNYVMSPDGLKVAIIGSFSDRTIRCVWADGSGDCGGGLLLNAGYGNPQWSADSQTIYAQGRNDDGWAGILAVPFNGGPSTVIFQPDELDYFWISNDHTKFAAIWPYGSGEESFFTIINLAGEQIVSGTASSVPWPDPQTPYSIFWAPDDSYLILDQQSLVSDWGFSGRGVKMSPDMSQWEYIPLPPEPVTDRSVPNYTFALVGGVMKILCVFYNDARSEEGIYQWDEETLAPEGWLIGSDYQFPEIIGHTRSRYNLCGIPVSTGFQGTDVHG